MAAVGKGQAGSMKKTAGGGYFLIPAGPSIGTSVSSAASLDTYGSWTEATASTSAALYIVGVLPYIRTTLAHTYVQIDIGTGEAASESSIGEVLGYSDETFDHGNSPIMLPFPIPVPAATRIAIRTAEDYSLAVTYKISLMCVDQSDLVDL